MKANTHFHSLKESYLFSDIAKRVAAFSQAHPDRSIIRLGIGDVTQPLAPAVIEALHRAVDEMGRADAFRGYGPEQGYDFLRRAIAEHDYRAHGVAMEEEEIFVSDGAKTDVGNFADILGTDNIVAITDPVYPVYLDSNLMAGRTIRFLPCSAQSGFLPHVPDFHADMIYLCSPNNPTGTAMTRDQLAQWVAYANEHHALLLFDSAYEAYIRDADVPHSVFEIPGARTCAVEFRSFSKTAGFTGLRCAYAVVPKELTAVNADGMNVSLQSLWLRRQCTKFNGVPYIVQRAAEAVYTSQGQREIRAQISYYQENARLIRQGLQQTGFTVYGGVNAPYIWMQCPDGDSWQFFQDLLEKAGVVGTPGVGFGAQGEGYFRLTAFGDREKTKEALARIAKTF